MREYRFALATAGATFVLLVIGGLVHSTGSSLACPDWPLCEGKFFPPMEGGILYEHGHRLVALAVAVLTVLLAILVHRTRREPPIRRLALLAVGLVAVQALLGGLTVIWKLPLLVSSAHLAVSMAFFAASIVLAHRLRPRAGPPPGRRGLVGAAALAAYAQIVVGGLVRHTGAALACGTGVPFCDGWTLWPDGGPARLHALHRILGLVLAALVIAAAAGVAREALRGGHRRRALLALAAPVLVAAQVLLGYWTVASAVAVPVVTAHLGAGALILADLLALYLSLGAGPAPARGEAEAAPGLARATG